MAAMGGAGGASDEQHENTFPDTNLNELWEKKAFISYQRSNQPDAATRRIDENTTKRGFRNMFYTNLIERDEINTLIERLSIEDREAFRNKILGGPIISYSTPLTEIIAWLSERRDTTGEELPIFSDQELRVFRKVMTEELQKSQEGGRRRRRSKRNTRRRRTTRRRRSSQRR